MLCEIVADLSRLTLLPLKDATGKEFFRIEIDILLLFGLTELKAQISWKENGVEKRGPAKIVYDPIFSKESENGLCTTTSADPPPKQDSVPVGQERWRQPAEGGTLLPQSQPPNVRQPSTTLIPDVRWKKDISKLEQTSTPFPKAFGRRDRRRREDVQDGMPFPQAFSNFRRNERIGEPVDMSPLEKTGWKRAKDSDRVGNMRLSRW